jgi:thiol-disulfide isomerase/thioredoxin
MRGPAAAALLAAALLLAGCDQAEPVAAACKVEVDTPELEKARVDAGIADCPDAGGAASADLPDVELACLGSDATGSLADVAGPAVINFWASNCGPCRKEMPALQEFHEQYGDQVSVLGVDYLETYPGAALDLAAQSGVTYPSYADPCGDLQQTELVVAGLPQFLFVAADGSVSQVAGGVESLDEIVELTEDELGLELTSKGAR